MIFNFSTNHFKFISEFQDVILVTQFELRDRLAKEIMEMEAYLDIEPNPQNDSVILSKCTLDNKIYRAKVNRYDILSCEDLGHLILLVLVHYFNYLF